MDNDPDYKKLDLYMKDLEEYYNKKFEQEKKMRMRKDGEKNEVEKYKRDKNNGEFLMNFHDFASIFSNLFIGFELNSKYSCLVIREKWDPKTPSGICKAKGASDNEATKFVRDNHQYILDLSAPTDILLLLIQQDGRLYRGEKYPYKTLCNFLGILSFTLQGGEKSLEKFDREKMTIDSLNFDKRREVTLWHRFQPGRYAIIPCRAKPEIEESEFEFRAYSESPVSLKKVKGPNNSFTPLRDDNPKRVNQSGITDML